MARARALVLHSGGLDSTVCLYQAIKDYGAANVISVGMNYGQKHQKELEAAEAICTRAGVRRLIHNIEGIFPKIGLADKDFVVPNVSYKEITGVSPTYVPFRNGTMLSVLAALASELCVETEGVENALYFGAHAEDAENWAYPDCTPEFIGAMANAIYIGTYHKLRLKAPLASLNKAGIIQLGMTLEVPFSMTWSCYKGEEVQCGICPTCISRREGFLQAHLHDMTVYANPLPGQSSDDLNHGY